VRTVKVKTTQIMQKKKQKISMFLHKNRRQAKLLRTWLQLAGCSVSDYTIDYTIEYWLY